MVVALSSAFLSVHFVLTNAACINYLVSHFEFNLLKENSVVDSCMIFCCILHMEHGFFTFILLFPWFLLSLCTSNLDLFLDLRNRNGLSAFLLFLLLCPRCASVYFTHKGTNANSTIVGDPWAGVES